MAPFSVISARRKKQFPSVSLSGGQDPEALQLVDRARVL